MRSILITPVLNGYIVEIGCQRVVFDNRKTLLSELKEYLEAPRETEERYRKSALNAKLVEPGEEPCQANRITPELAHTADAPMPVGRQRR